MIQLLPTGGAEFSADGLHRYLLWRQWNFVDHPATALFIMLNPSTADAERNDPTVRRCITFAQRERCDRLEVVNLYAYRATKPADAARATDPVGPANDDAIRAALGRCHVAVAAWGASWRKIEPKPRRLTAASARQALPPGHVHRPAQVAALAWNVGRFLYCLGETDSGDPRHPLYVPADEPLRRWC